jgi:transposase
MGLSRLIKTVKGVLVNKIVVRLEHRVKLKLRQMRRETQDKGLAIRCQIVLLAAKGRVRRVIAEAVGCSASWVNRVVARFDQHGIAGLMDRREDNGTLKLSECFLSTLYDVVDGSPRDYGYPRPTWTRELMVKVMHRLTGVKVHPATLSRALQMIRARLGRPRPTVGCPWPKRRRNRRLAEIRAVLDMLAADEIAVYLDEVDVHLNPKIGLDWMNCGTQKEVPTPGQNVKRYLCGALNAQSGRLTWVKAEKKNSLLFIAMLHRLVESYPEAKVIHVVLDNFKIHDSKASRAAVEALGGKIVLHPLPPYCPQHNKIERVWLDVHANVTRNHTCPDMDDLTRRVTNYLSGRNRGNAAKMRDAA